MKKKKNKSSTGTCDRLNDEGQWDETFENSADKLSDAAQKVRREIAQGKTETMDYDRL